MSFYHYSACTEKSERFLPTHQRDGGKNETSTSYVDVGAVNSIAVSSRLYLVGAGWVADGLYG
jgi:hypothetical protein